MVFVIRLNEMFPSVTPYMSEDDMVNHLKSQLQLIANERGMSTKWIINIYGINLLDCLNKSWLLLVRCYGMKKEEISKESEAEGKKVSWKTTKALDQEVMQCLLSIMSHLVGVPEIYPKVLIIGGSGRCGQGAAYILEKTGIPR